VGEFKVFSNFNSKFEVCFVFLKIPFSFKFQSVSLFIKLCFELFFGGVCGMKKHKYSNTHIHKKY